MNMRLPGIGIVLFVLAFAPTFTMESARGRAIFHGRQTPGLTHRVANRAANCESTKKHIGLERYRLLKRLAPKIGDLPLFETGESYCTALFPIGRSDRLYLLLWNVYLTHHNVMDSTATNMLLCYQHQNGADKLLYKINLHTKSSPSKRVTRIKSLLDFLNSGEFWLRSGAHSRAERYAMTGRMGDFAKKDLAVNRDYVQYSYVPYTDMLEVWLPSDRENGRPPAEGKIARYDLGEDPFTKAKLKKGEFYRKYGLPVTQEEVSHLTRN